VDQAIAFWHLYSKETGYFTGTSSSGPPGTCPDSKEGFAWFEGLADVQSQRLDLTDPENPTLVDWQPPSPGPDYAWDEKARRHVLTPLALQRMRDEADARGAISRAEDPTLRALRELLLSPTVRALFTAPADLDNLQRLQDADTAIAAARGALQAPATPEEGGDVDAVLSR